MCHILIPMGGLGTRFSVAGYDKPKPLIEFLGKPMIRHVVENLGLHNHYTICLQQSVYEMDKPLFDYLAKQVKKMEYVFMNGLSEGPASTCLLAKHLIDHRQMLIIANCDQIMEWNQTRFEKWFYNKDNFYTGAIFTFPNDGNHLSYAAINEKGLVTKTAEKEIISKHATTGIYVFDQGHDFVWAAEQMIAKNIRAPNREFYVAPVYNELIECGLRIAIYDDIKHYPIGTPVDLQEFIKKNTL